MTDIVKGLRLLVPSDSSGAAIKAIDEITRLRNELHIAHEWSARVIAGQEEDANQITALRAENEKLRAALKAISEVKPNWGSESEEMYELARAALEGK